MIWVVLNHSSPNRRRCSGVWLNTRNPSDLLGFATQDPDNATIQSYDPPHSVPLRRAIVNAFRSIDVEGICISSSDQLNIRIDAVASGSCFNFMHKVSSPVALYFACHLMGISQKSVGDYYPIFLKITEAMDSDLDARRQGPGVQATAELNELITASMPEAPAGTVIGELLRDPEVIQMPTGYVRNTVSAMFNAAFSTAYASMGSFLNLVLKEPDLADKIIRCRSLDAAAQELIRLTSPAQATMRFAAQDLYIKDVLIKKTDPVIALLAAANHDPVKFDRPGEFDPERDFDVHLGFGWGVHFCVGAMPAHTFLKQYLTRLDQCVASLRPAGKPQWQETVTLRCLKTLPVRKK